MSLLAGILELDEQVFLSLNSLFPASSDTFWLAVTKTITWIPLYVVILARLIKTAPNHSTWLFRIALTIVGVLIWDQGAGLFKDGSLDQDLAKKKLKEFVSSCIAHPMDFSQHMLPMLLV